MMGNMRYSTKQILKMSHLYTGVITQIMTKFSPAKQTKPSLWLMVSESSQLLFQRLIDHLSFSIGCIVLQLSSAKFKKLTPKITKENTLSIQNYCSRISMVFNQYFSEQHDCLLCYKTHW